MKGPELQEVERKLDRIVSELLASGPDPYADSLRRLFERAGRELANGNKHGMRRSLLELRQHATSHRGLADEQTDSMSFKEWLDALRDLSEAIDRTLADFETKTRHER